MTYLYQAYWYNTSHSVRNLAFIFDEHLSFSDQISSLSRSCFSLIRDLRRIRSHIDFKTARTIATSIVHSKLDYCNSLYLALPGTQIHRLQLIQDSLARSVVRAPKYAHCSPILKTLHWLNVHERIQHKILLLTYKVLTNSQPVYLSDLVSIQPPRSTRSSSVTTLLHPGSASSLKITNRSFRYASAHLMISGINYHMHSATLIFSHPLSHLSRHHLHASLIHSFTLNLKRTFFLKLFHLSRLYLHRTDFTVFDFLKL